MSWIQKLFSFQKEKRLKKEIAELKTKLDERQEAINKTNAYWKKKVHELTRKTSTVKSL